jgi:hypothetical protein
MACEAIERMRHFELSQFFEFDNDFSAMNEEFFRDRSLDVPDLLFLLRVGRYSRRDANEK